MSASPEFVTSYCLLCGTESPVTQAVRTCCEQARAEDMRQHPDWNTPNWCNTCSPKGYSCCRCEVASSE